MIEGLFGFKSRKNRIGELMKPKVVTQPTVLTAPQIEVIDRLAEKLEAALDTLGKAKAFAKPTYQTDVFQIAETLLNTDRGMRVLYEKANIFDTVGVFSGGPWADTAKLQPSLVSGSLQASGVYPVVEILSELRLLAYAKGRADATSQKSAVTFLNEVMALNLEYIFPADTEEERIAAGPHRDASLRLFSMLAEELGLEYLREDVVSEIEQICAQRPIMVGRVHKMIQMASRIPDDSASSEKRHQLRLYTDAVNGPSPMSQSLPELLTYRKKLMECDTEVLKAEAKHFTDAMHTTGLTSPHHAVLLRHLHLKHPDLVGDALALNDMGEAEFAQNRELALQLIKFCIHPSTAQSIYGFAKILQLGLLSRQEVRAGFSRLINLDLQSDVRHNLLAQRQKRDGVTANALLVAGAISVFGQPLGVGQGRNPTCQAARGISLWAQHAHGYLIALLISAARDGFLEIPFEGEAVRTDKIINPNPTRHDLNLDAVSIVLVPHLDLAYCDMMTRVALRQEDSHKWVNPALYGRWVPNGFASVFRDRAQTTVAQYEDFIRRFFATHHPAFNDGHSFMYPNPVGILVTNSHGDYLGPHAVSLQRVVEGPKGELRAYFFNPNNEGRQDWGLGVKPQIRGHGEIEGESSLPLHEFVARLYAFHYNPYEEGDAYAVPASAIKEIESAARGSWGKAFTWVD
jgi:hypothetical protein